MKNTTQMIEEKPRFFCNCRRVFGFLFLLLFSVFHSQIFQKKGVILYCTRYSHCCFLKTLKIIFVKISFNNNFNNNNFKIMKKKLSLLFLALQCSIFVFAQTENVGINTANPDPSAILEVSADSAPNYLVTTKKGFLPPSVALKSNIDATTVTSPAKGLLVFNTANAGTFPNEVTANTFYYWNGSTWDKIIHTSVVEEAVKPRVFYIESTDTQTFTSTDMNSATGITPKDNVVTFSTPLINSNNVVTFSSADSVFEVNVSGIYQVSCFVNYNPMATITSGNYNKRAFLNMKIQKLVGGTWVDSFGSRTAWGEDGSQLKTAILMATPFTLSKGDKIRMVIANPFDSSANNNHCGGGNCYIGADAANGIPIAKALRLQLIDYNL